MRAVMVCYQLSNLLLYKHELLLSKCPLTADWLLIRPVWNEISSEPLNYDPIPEHIISHTYTLPPSLSSTVYFCLLSSYLVASSASALLPLRLLFPPSSRLSTHLTSCPVSFLLFFPPPLPSLRRVQLQWEGRRVRVWHGAVPEHRQWGALCELQRQHRRAPLWALQREPPQEIWWGALPALQLQY